MAAKKKTKSKSKSKQSTAKKSPAKRAPAAKKAAPKKAAPKKAAPKKAAAKKAAPNKATAKKAAPNKAAAKKAAPNKAAPKKAAPQKAAPKPVAASKPKRVAEVRDLLETITAVEITEAVETIETIEMSSGVPAPSKASLAIEILAMARQLYGPQRGDAELLALDPNSIDEMDPSMFYELVQERYGVSGDPTNDYFEGFGGTIQHLIAFVEGRWDGETRRETPMPPSDWLEEYVHPAGDETVAEE